MTTTFNFVLVDVETEEELGDAYFCHAQIQADHTGTRLLVNATGSPDIVLPEGFGLPFSEVIAAIPAERRHANVFGMVLNNFEEAEQQFRQARCRLLEPRLGRRRRQEGLDRGRDYSHDGISLTAWIRSEGFLAIIILMSTW